MTAPQSKAERTGAHIGSPSRAGEPARARVIAIANQKGGVGKTTTAVSLGAGLAELGHRVLVVDLDPQANASTGLGVREAVREASTYEVLLAGAPIEEAVVETGVPGLFGVPATLDLAGAEIELVSQLSREMRLARALDPIRDGAYDFVLLDCPPSLGLITVNALAAADELIVPIQCEYYAMEGLVKLLRNVRLVQQSLNPRLRLGGIVLTMFDSRTRLAEQVAAEVRGHFGSRVYDTIIPRTVRLSEAPSYGQPITVYDPRSKGAASYRTLAMEVAEGARGDETLPVVDEVPGGIARKRERPVRETQRAAADTQHAAGAEEMRETAATEPTAGAETVARVDEERVPSVAVEEERTLEEEEPAPSVVVIEDEDLSEPSWTEVAAEGGDYAGGDSTVPRRKRWRLFRKGGDQ